MMSTNTISLFKGPGMDGCLPRKNLKVLTACLGLFAAFANALPIQGEHLFLQS